MPTLANTSTSTDAEISIDSDEGGVLAPGDDGALEEVAKVDDDESDAPPWPRRSSFFLFVRAGYSWQFALWRYDCREGCLPARVRKTSSLGYRELTLWPFAEWSIRSTCKKARSNAEL